MSRAVARSRPVAPRHPRRVSGPAAPVRPRAVPGRPRPTRPIPAPPTFATRVRALPDARLLDRLLRSRAWIWLLGIALGGIVAMQVSLLGMNASAAENIQRATDFQRSNAALEAEISRLAGGDRVAAAAANAGLITPDAGETPHLRARPKLDPGAAADNITPPSPVAQSNVATTPATVDPGVATAPATATGPEATTP